MSLHGTDFESEFGVGLGSLASRAISNQSTGGFAGQAVLSNSLGGALGSGLGGTDGMGGNIFGKGGLASTALGGLQALGSIWNSFQQNKIAKKSFKLQKRAFETNLANSTEVYNQALEDRIRVRYIAEGLPSADADAKIAERRL